MPSYASQALDLTNVGSWLRQPVQEPSFTQNDPYIRERGSSNLAMIDSGRQQIHRSASGLAQGLRQYMSRRPLRGAPPVRIYTSPWARTAETAQILAQHLAQVGVKPDIHTIEELAPQSLGAYEGRVSKEVEPQLKQLREEQPENAAPGRSKYTDQQAETTLSYRNRIIPTAKIFMHEIEQHPGLLTFIAAHSSDMRTIRGEIDPSAKGDFVPGQVDKMSIGNDGRWRYESNWTPGLHPTTPGLYLQHHGETEFNKPRPELLRERPGRSNSGTNPSVEAEAGSNSSGFPANITPPTPNIY